MKDLIVNAASYIVGAMAGIPAGIFVGILAVGEVGLGGSTAGAVAAAGGASFGTVLASSLVVNAFVRAHRKEV